MSGNREKLVAQFRELVGERLGRVTRALMSLEAGADVEAGKQTLRELHGLKGEARMMGFQDINALVHQMEEVLRAGEPRGYALAPSSVDALLVVGDAVAVLAGAAQGEAPDVPRLLAWLATSLQQERGEPAAPQGPPPSAPRPPPQPEKRPATEQRSDTTIRISQQSLERLTSASSNLSQRARQRALVDARRRQLSRELTVLHRLAEDLGPLAQELATRLGRAKELASEINRGSTLITTAEQKDLAELSEEITALRMVPLAGLFEPYPRMVRELARDLGKEAELVLEGEAQRIDRSVLEALKDPLLHLVRNAIDHGLEAPPDRAAAGKPPKGRVLLRARREGERLVIRVEDDGRGVDPAAIRALAVKKRLIDEALAARLPDAAAVDLVFLPGFTSREAVTDVSGRGVGLDAVRTQLLGVGGEVVLESTPGQGAAFELRVPVSLTVAPVLFVEAGDERLCLTASNVERAFTVEVEDVCELAGRPALRLEDRVLPFSTLASLLFGATERKPAPGELVLVVQGRGQVAAVGVDRVLEERVQSILPLKGLLSRYAHLSGATPLADGELALVVSAPHLVATAHGRELRLASALVRPQLEQRRRVLVVDDSPLTRELLVSLLEAVGYAVTQANDGAQALEQLNRERVDVVVTDLEMPRVDGLELTRRLKQHPTLRTLPVVIVTTRGSDADRQRGMEAGADGYVTKGDLVRQDLVDVVARLLA